MHYFPLYDEYVSVKKIVLEVLKLSDILKIKLFIVSKHNVFKKKKTKILYRNNKLEKQRKHICLTTLSFSIHLRVLLFLIALIFFYLLYCF